MSTLLPRICAAKRVHISALTFLLVLTRSESTAYAVDQRSWELKDSVEMTYFAPLPYSSLGFPIADTPAVPQHSPNGKYFFVVTKRGVLARDSNYYELVVFSNEDITQALKKHAADVLPVTRAGFESNSSTLAGIDKVGWSSDSKSIFFTADGTAPGTRSIRQLQLSSKKVVTLVEEVTKHVALLGHGGGSLAYAIEVERAYQAPYPIIEVDRSRDGFAMQTFPREAGTAFTSRLSFHGQQSMQSDFSSGVDFSPDGNFAVGVDRHGETVIIDGTGASPQVVGRAQFGKGAIEEIDDTGRKVHRLLTNSPQFWTRDGSRVVLVNVRRSADPDVVADRSSPFGDIVEYNVITKQWTVIKHVVEPGSERNAHLRYVTRVDFDPVRNSLSLNWDKEGKADGKQRFSLQDGKWTAIDDAATGSDDEKKDDQETAKRHFSIKFAQTADNPAALVASDGISQITLLDTDASIAGVRIAQTTLFRWRDPNTQTPQIAALLMPTEHKGTKPYPLVIQIERHLRSEDLKFFLPDGRSGAGFSAQTLAACGFVVARISGVPTDEEGLRDEGTRVVKRLDALVDSLVTAGFIDPDRVGIVGHSRSGYHVYYTIAHPERTRYAAAVALDGYTGDYSNYLVHAAETRSLPGSVYDYENMRGGSFWDMKGAWLESASGFNIDRVRTPTLIAQHLNTGTRDWWAAEQIGAFRLCKKPLEVLFFPSTMHVPIRPKQRLAEMQAVVEWMQFWLQNKDPESAERAKRWAILRKQQDDVLKAPEPAKGTWIFVPQPASSQSERAIVR